MAKTEHFYTIVASDITWQWGQVHFREQCDLLERERIKGRTEEFSPSLIPLHEA